MVEQDNEMDEEEYGQEAGENNEDDDAQDLNNYKGIYFQDDAG
jgi:hypothetical protein